jgi:predicted nucleic acid-binding protein
MLVVSDTPPLSGLLAVGKADLFSQLFGDVVIPEEVQRELLRGHSSIPDWLRVEAVKNSADSTRLSQMVDNGEAEAITLAKELHADRLLIDERKGRRLAIQEGVQVIGLLGVVIFAKRQRLIPSAQFDRGTRKGVRDVFGERRPRQGITNGGCVNARYCIALPNSSARFVL